MGKDKNIRVVIPAEFNKNLSKYLIDIRDLGVETTKAELIIKLAILGFQQEIKIER